jgi:hypothetical protein
VTSAGFTENFEAVAYPIDRMRKLWGVNVDGTYLFATGVARHLVRFFVPVTWSGGLVQQTIPKRGRITCGPSA